MENTKAQSVEVSKEALQPLPFVRKGTYLLGDFGSNFSWAFISSFLSFFWTDVLGVAPAFVGTIILVSRFWDAINDPLVGTWSDRTRTKWGSYRPWILWFAVPMAIMNVVTFTAFSGLETPLQKNLFALITFFVYVFIFTCVNIPYSAMASVTTLNSAERSKLASFRLIGSYAGNLIVSRFTLKLVASFGGGNQVTGFSRTAMLYSVIMIISWVICFAGAKEVVVPKTVEKVKVKMSENFKAMKGNAPVLILCFGFLVYGFFSYGRAATAMYYFTYNAGDSSWFSTYSLFNVGGLLLGSILMPRVAHMFKNKATVPKIGFFAVTAACFFLGVAINPTKASHIWALFIIQLITSILQGMSVSSLYAMIPDTTEYTQIKHGLRAPGFISSMTSFFMKLGMGVGAGGIGYVLAWFGYVAGQEQTARALMGIKAMFFFVPACFTLIAAILLCFYKLDKATYAKMVEELGMNKATDE